MCCECSYGQGARVVRFFGSDFLFLCLFVLLGKRSRPASWLAPISAAGMWNSVIIDGGNVSRLQHHRLLLSSDLSVG